MLTMLEILFHVWEEVQGLLGILLPEAARHLRYEAVGLIVTILTGQAITYITLLYVMARRNQWGIDATLFVPMVAGGAAAAMTLVAFAKLPRLIATAITPFGALTRLLAGI